jgi:hypothetical protein
MGELEHAMENRYQGLPRANPHPCQNWFVYYLALLVILNCVCVDGVTARAVHACMYKAVTNAWFQLLTIGEFVLFCNPDF